MRISDWSSDVCSSDLAQPEAHALVGGLREGPERELRQVLAARQVVHVHHLDRARAQDARAVEFAAPAQHLAKAQVVGAGPGEAAAAGLEAWIDRKSTRLNSSH